MTDSQFQMLLTLVQNLDKKVDDFKSDVNRRFEQSDKRFDQMFDLLRDEKHEREKMEDKLEKVYESRNRVTVSFTRTWATASMFMALMASTIVLSVAKAF
jgi:hypothetical protein